MTVEPGSAVPVTFSVPFGLAVAATEGADGGVVSVYVLAVAGDAFPAASVPITDTVPAGCGAAEVAV